ncbi:MAG: NAD-dependent succinate-semialdehyde dehydrogenase [Candidatus Schekmanbacteria bacterium]|nr:NAD-dependent succinate-semialdehyde dehydrogenase [Candidatus Schekmanbacteria bacterium]
MSSPPNQLFIDGHWVGPAEREVLEVIDPATEQLVDRVPVATDADIDAALAASAAAFAEWRHADAWTRSQLLRKVSAVLREWVEPMAATLTEEQGKPLREARGELAATADQFDWYADEARRIYGRVIDGHARDNRLLVLRQPVGPVAAFSPWNFPALLPARKIAAAVAAGCSIIIKPAEEAPRTCLWLARACAEAGAPRGLINVVTGHPEHISTRLIRADVIRKVSLTGSVPVGKKLLKLCAELVKPASMELGGHAPVLVFADADVERAAETAARAKFRNSGQVCIAASRFFVHAAIAEAFTRRFVEVTRALRLGDGRDPDTDIGPLASSRRRDAAEALVADAVARGARVRWGGERPAAFPRGFYFFPTVLTGVTDEMRVMNEEPFCPIAPITTFATFDEAVARANRSDYGLAAYVFSRDTKTTFLAAEALEAGMVGVNNMVIATAEAPFGGVKMSGCGREGGSEGIEAYTHTKYVNIGLWDQ